MKMVKEYPKISVITPSYNQADFLEETILSVLNQNYPNLEYIIIDGGSTDRSVEIIKKYEKHLSYWVSEKDNGQSHAINKGLQHATGEIICWLCSDDLHVSDTLHTVAELFQLNPEIALLHGTSILFGNRRKEQITGADFKDLPLRYYAIIPFPQPSSFFKRKVIEETGMLDESLHFGMDYDLLVRIALCYPILPVNKVLSRYRLHSSSKTVSQFKNFAGDWIKVFSRFLRSVDGTEKHISFLKENDFYHEDSTKYKHLKEFNETDLRRIHSHFLFNQLVIYYEVYDRKMIHKILVLIKETDPVFYKEYNLRKVEMRKNLFPPVIVHFVRTFIR